MIPAPIRPTVTEQRRDLAAALESAGYRLLNTVKWKPVGDPARWQEVLKAFAKHFPKLERPV